MNIAIYGTGEYATYFVNKLEIFETTGKFKEKKDIFYKILYFVESFPDKEICNVGFATGMRVLKPQEINFDEIDYLVVAIRDYEQIVQYIKDTCGGAYEKNKKKIVWSRDFELYSKEYSDKIQYVSCMTKDQLVYLYSSGDKAIGSYMIYSKKNWSDELIQGFFRLSEQYYAIKGNYFLDIGANIGTTAIYVKKIIAPHLNIIAIEPGKKNYNLLKCNCILNACEDINCLNIALSDKNQILAYKYNVDNPGGSTVVDIHELSFSSQKVEACTLPYLLEQQQVHPDDIGYIWIDTEGFENKILKGAYDLLRCKKIPLIQEFNPAIYYKNGELSEYCDMMAKCYDGFIVMDEYLDHKEKEYHITDLYQYGCNICQTQYSQKDLFFI